MSGTFQSRVFETISLIHGNRRNINCDKNYFLQNIEKL
jgi:hypothetical protein